MLAILYLFVAYLLGDALCRRFFPFVSTPHRIASGLLCGLLVSTWATYGFAYLFADTSYPMLAGNLLFFVAALVVAFMLNRGDSPAAGTSIDPESTRFLRADWIVTTIFFVVAVVMAYGTFTMNEGTIRIAHHQSSDFGSTASIMQSFAVGHNFPTEYPHFAGDRIRYHFLFYFQAGNLEYLGLSPASANNVLNILSTLSLLVLVMTFGSVLFRSRLAGRIGAILFYFHGSLAYITFYFKQGSLSAVWDRIWKMQDFLSSGLPYRGEDWGVWSQVVYLNQRHLASSIGIFLVVLVFLAIRHRERYEAGPTVVASGSEVAAESSDGPDEAALAVDAADIEGPEAKPTANSDENAESVVGGGSEVSEAREKSSGIDMAYWATRLAPYAFCGLILGLMPMWNGAVFAGAAGVLAVMFLVLPFRREMLAIAVVSGLVALPQVIFLKSGLAPAGYSTFYFGYTLSEPTVASMLYYLGFTFGFKWIFIGIALVFADRLQRLMIVSITALIVMATCFQFSEEVLANHKFFNVWVVLINVPVGFGIIKLWNLLPSSGAIFARILTAVMVFLIVIGGILDLFPVRNSFWVDYRFENDQLVDWVRNNTDPRSIWLSHRYVNHGILMAGRRLYYGHPYYAWGAGYPVGERDNTYRQMLEGKDINEVFRLIKENNIDYVAIDNTIRSGSDFIKNHNERLFAAYFPTVFVDEQNSYNGLKIYKVPDQLGAPDPAVKFEPSPTPSPEAAVNAFAGGEGTAYGKFSRPRGIAVDTKGNMYVADMGNARIQKFDANGTFVAAFGKAGTAEGEIKEPNGIAVDDAGNIYLTDAFNHKLIKFDPKGTVLKEWKGPEPGFYGPRDIAFGPNKKLYIVDQGRTRVVRFDPATEEFMSWGSSGSGESQFAESTGIGIGDDMVFVADNGNNRVQIFDLDGKFIRQFEVTGWERYVWNYPDVAYDPTTKNLLVSNPWRDEVLVYDVLGNINAEKRISLKNPTSIVLVDPKGGRKLIALATSLNLIQQYEVPK